MPYIRFSNDTEMILELISQHAGSDGARARSALFLTAGHPATRFLHMRHFFEEKWLKASIGDRYELTVAGFRVRFWVDSDPDCTVEVEEISFSDRSPITIESLLTRYPLTPRTSH